MFLTEAQINLREDLFLELLDEVANEVYHVDESYEPTDDDYYITSIMMEYFVNHYKTSSNLRESVTSVLLGESIQEDDSLNDELYEEIIEMMLDETVGKFVAGAAYGIQKGIAKLKLKGHQHLAARAKTKSSKVSGKAKMAVSKSNAMQKVKGGGLAHNFKSSIAQGKADKLSSRSADANIKAKDAARNRDLAASKHKSVVGKQTKLANKIDTGISNVKNKVKSAISGGVSRVGKAIGRVAGAF